MKKSRKVVSVSTSMKDEHVSLPKSKSQLAQLHDDDDEDVFATSVIDRYAARPLALKNICLATFAVMYDVIQSSTKTGETQDVNTEDMQNTENAHALTKMKLQKGLGVIRKRKQQVILCTRRYKIYTEPEKYYHSKLLLYYPWNEEDDIISTYQSYLDSYINKQDIIHQNAQKFSEDCVAFDIDLQDLENNIPQSAWEMVAPNVAQDERTTNVQGFYTLQNQEQRKEDTMDTVSHDNTRNTTDTLCMLYAKAAKRQDMNFHDYCTHIHIYSMNQTMCTLKGTTDGNWGDICILAVGDLHQWPPVGQCPIYMSPQTVHTLHDIASNGWEKMQLHELTQSMRQKDMKFVNCLNKIHTTVPLEGSEEDRMLQACELKLNPNNENYPHDAMHIYA